MYFEENVASEKFSFNEGQEKIKEKTKRNRPGFHFVGEALLIGWR
jgi:hypothetical protein